MAVGDANFFPLSRVTVKRVERQATEWVQFLTLMSDYQSFSLWLALFVSYLRSHCLPQVHKDNLYYHQEVLFSFSFFKDLGI